MRHLLFIFGLIPFFFYSQEYSFSYNFVNYNINNGFPSSEVYYGLKDAKGFFWFATDKGVSRFNGIDFETYDTEKGLPDNTIMSIFEDKVKNLWFSSSNALSVFDMNSNVVTPYKYNDVIIKARLSSPIIASFVDEKGDVYLILEEKGYIHIDSEGKLNKYFNTIVFDRKYGFYEKNENSFNPIFWNNSKLPSMIFEGFINSPNNQEIYTNKETIVIAKDDYTLEIRSFQNLSIQTYKSASKINSVTLKERSQTLLFSTDNGIVKYFATQNKKLDYLRGSKINYSLEGSKSGLYVLSQDNGLYIIPSSSILALNINGRNDQAPINTLLSNSEDLYIYKEDANHPIIFSNYNFANSSKELSLQDLKTINPNSQGEPIQIKVPNNYTFKFTSPKNYLSCKSFTFKNDDLFILCEDGFYQIHKNEIQRVSRLDIIAKQSNSICFFDNHLYIGTHVGVYQFNTKTNTLSAVDSLANYDIIDIKNYYDKFILFGTQSKGLILYRMNEVKILNTDNILTSNLINGIHVSQYKIWLATGNGVVELSESEGQYHFRLTDAYSYADGLNSTDITSITQYNEEIFVGSKYGLNKITPFLKSKNYLKIFIKHLKINDQNVPINSQISVPHNASLEIDLMLNSYNSTTPITYYRIKELNDQYRITSNLDIVYESLGSGDYTIEFYAKDFIEQTPVKSIKISVSAPWYAKWYIIVFFVLLTIVLIYLLVHFYSNKIQAEYKKEQEINRYKLLAFNKQMSSHFISNSFNAINNFILKNDNVGGSRYLSKMSKLFRHSLLSTEKNYIPFNKEIEALRSYIELEKLRYNNSFSYEIYISKDVSINRISIMPLILQTLIENAIWHGILPSEREDKIIRINVEPSESPNLLQVTIEDNGVGIDLEQLQKEDSKGIALVKAILETNQFAYKKHSKKMITFENVDPEIKNKGTRCMVLIPIILSV